MKVTKIYIADNGKISKTDSEKEEWSFPSKLTNIITGDSFDCDNESFKTEREAIKEHGKSQGGYFIETIRRRTSGSVKYDDIAAVTVVEYLNEYGEHLKKVRAKAFSSAEVELRLAEIRSMT